MKERQLSSISPTSNKSSSKKKSKKKIISIKNNKKQELEASEILKEKSLKDKFEEIMVSLIPDYKQMNYERVTPSLILKFSKALELISLTFEKEYEESPNSPTPAPKSVLHYIQRAYESFLKRIVGISCLEEVEGVLKN